MPTEARSSVTRPGAAIGPHCRFDAPHSGIDADDIAASTCPACGHHVAVQFLDSEPQPLATVAWPKSDAEARAMPRLPLAFVRCVDCGHVYNAAFDYANVPYSEKPNLMFNRGGGWTAHLRRVCDLLLEWLPRSATVVEVGCGEGHLLREMADRRPDANFIGFDPNAAVHTGGLFEARAELFVPQRHLAECRPDLVISRHVLEHLVNPLGFLQTLVFAAGAAGIETRVFIEVPCIDRVIETGRTVDFYYEHNSHFTTESFTRMLHRGTSAVELLLHGYHREVICGLAKIGGTSSPVQRAAEARRFRENGNAAIAVIRDQLAGLHASGTRVVVWGGTGKAAAFMNRYGMDAARFPLVVDSDPGKVGTYVPGCGQRIVPRDDLLESPPDVVILPMQWRARDVIREMQEAGISFGRVLIEHAGRLVDFECEPHPY
jgi:Methyltransferase domain/C-methyltransferase C-terminal domain